MCVLTVEFVRKHHSFLDVFVLCVGGSASMIEDSASCQICLPFETLTYREPVRLYFAAGFAAGTARLRDF